MNIYDELCRFYEEYGGEKRIVGYSCEGRKIFAFFVGKHAPPVGISQYAIHAREWITAYLALAHIKRGTECGGVWFVPLANPDGALLCTEGIASVQIKWRRQFLLRINGGEDFSMWKANAEAVDLNVNFDARWGTGARNVTRPSPENYVGIRPFCAPESLALKDFTYAVNPAYTLSWHTKGEEIYWRFHQPPLRALRDKKLAGLLSESTGYPLKEAPRSAGGYKDWCVEKLKIPAFTIEAGSDALSYPLGFQALGGLLRKNYHAVADFSKGFGERR